MCLGHSWLNSPDVQAHCRSHALSASWQIRNVVRCCQTRTLSLLTAFKNTPLFIAVGFLDRNFSGTQASNVQLAPNQAEENNSIAWILSRSLPLLLCTISACVLEVFCFQFASHLMLDTFVSLHVMHGHMGEVNIPCCCSNRMLHASWSEQTLCRTVVSG